MALGASIGKVPVLVGVCDGFVGNRMLAQRGARRERLLLEGALPQEIDARADRVRLPRWARSRWATSPASTSAGASARRVGKVRAGRRRDVRAGPLRPEDRRRLLQLRRGPRTAEPDPEVEAIIVDVARASWASTRRADRADEEIVERLLYPMINEGARILEEGIAARARRHRRDLALRLRLAGLARRPDVLRRPDRAGAHSRPVAGVRGGDGRRVIEPAPLLARLAEEGKGFG